jgi:hypothetical protein
MSDNESSNREKVTVQEAGAKGGRARAENMTPEQRKEAARRAAEERWRQAGKETGASEATHTGELKLGELKILCAVLRDGTRVLSETGVVKALGLYRSGAVQSREKEAAEGGAQLPLFVANKNIKPFVDQELADVLTNPIWYIPKGSGTKHKGIKAEVIPRICDVWLKARDAKKLRGKRQDIVAVKADIIMRALAHVGITALVDEATGYQDDRARDALAKILEAFIAKELRKWVSTFPPDFYKEMFRLRGIPYNGQLKKPAYVGHLTNDLVYARLAPGVLKKLRELNPVRENGRRQSKHHQWLTEEVGVPELKDHLKGLITLMRATEDKDWKTFYRMLERALPKHIDLPLWEWADSQKEEQSIQGQSANVSES